MDQFYIKIGIKKKGLLFKIYLEAIRKNIKLYFFLHRIIVTNLSSKKKFSRPKETWGPFLL